MGFAHGGDGHRQRLEQCGGLIGHGIRYRMGHFGVDGDVSAECAVDGRCGVELHLRAEVVAARPTLPAAPARMLGLDCHPLTDSALIDALPHRCDTAGQFMSQDHRCLDDEVADPPVAVVVHVGSAHPDGGDLDEHFMRAGRRDGPVLDLEAADSGHHAGPHGARAGGAGSGCGHVIVSFRSARARWANRAVVADPVAVRGPPRLTGPRP